jgi:hypothetical protein
VRKLVLDKTVKAKLNDGGIDRESVSVLDVYSEDGRMTRSNRVVRLVGDDDADVLDQAARWLRSGKTFEDAGAELQGLGGSE